MPAQGGGTEIFMYCRNCGKEMNPNAAVCPNCGFAKNTGTHYCASCGSPLIDGAEFCTGCGTSANPNRVYTGTVQGVNAKSRLAAALLGIFLGSLGIHNFYLGYTKRGLTQLLSCGILGFAVGVWALVESIMLLTRTTNTDADGVPLSE